MSEQYDKLKELINQSDAFYKNEQYEKAIEYLLKALELNLTQEEKAEIWSMIGYVYYDVLEMWKEAIHAYLKCVELMPNSFVYHEKLGKAYKYNEQYEKAIESLLKSIELNPNKSEKAEILDIIGGIYHEYLEMYEEAIQTYLKCLELVPDSLHYLYCLGSAYDGNKQYEKAIKIFLNLIERKPNVELYWFALACSYAGEGTKALLRCAELKPDYEIYLIKLGELYTFNGQFKEAIQTYLKSIELESSLSFNCYEYLGKAYEYNEQSEKAIESFLEAIKLNPNEPHMYILLGDAYIRNEKYKDAIKVFEKVIELLKKS